MRLWSLRLLLAIVLFSVFMRYSNNALFSFRHCIKERKSKISIQSTFDSFAFCALHSLWHFIFKFRYCFKCCAASFACQQTIFTTMAYISCSLVPIRTTAVVYDAVANGGDDVGLMRRALHPFNNTNGKNLTQ